MNRTGKTDDNEHIPEISPEDVERGVADGKPFVIVDVREESEWVRGHIPGAVLIPLGELVDRVDELPSDQPIVAVCRSGNRSGAATKFLNAQGRDTRNMVGGMLAWKGDVQTGSA